MKRTPSIYFTGDLHGDVKRMSGKKLRKLRRGDVLIVCGDFGFVWDGSSEEEKILKWLGKRKYHIAFIEGTHDNLELLEKYPVEEWNGGLVHSLGGNLHHLIRGQIFTIAGKTLLAMGGGESDDFTQREPGVNWWPQELPKREELDLYWKRLDDIGNQLDYVVTHQAPTNIDSCLTHRVCEVNLLTAFLDSVQRKCTFKGWFFGNYHVNKTIPPYYHCLYDDVMQGE